jgi:hypothetical protein
LSPCTPAGASTQTPAESYPRYCGEGEAAGRALCFGFAAQLPRRGARRRNARQGAPSCPARFLSGAGGRAEGRAPPRPSNGRGVEDMCGSAALRAAPVPAARGGSWRGCSGLGACGSPGYRTLHAGPRPAAPCSTLLRPARACPAARRAALRCASSDCTAQSAHLEALQSVEQGVQDGLDLLVVAVVGVPCGAAVPRRHEDASAHVPARRTALWRPKTAQRTQS